jgi:hypothetical protein
MSIAFEMKEASDCAISHFTLDVTLALQNERMVSI